MLIQLIKIIQVEIINKRIKINSLHKLPETSVNVWMLVVGYYKRRLLQIEYNGKKNSSKNIWPVYNIETEIRKKTQLGPTKYV